MTTSTKKIQIEKISKYAVWVLALALIGLAITYAFLVNQTVLNVVEREKIEKGITLLSSEVSRLEATYISRAQKIDLNLAYQMGFSEPKEKKFVSRAPLVETVSLNGE